MLNTLYHKMIIGILKYIGFDSTSANLMENRFKNRTQAVKLNNEISQNLKLQSGVQKGSIFIPLIFTIYTLNLTEVIHFCRSHHYADYAQLYFSFPGNDFATISQHINEKIASITEQTPISVK